MPIDLQNEKYRNVCFSLVTYFEMPETAGTLQPGDFYPCFTGKIPGSRKVLK